VSTRLSVDLFFLGLVAALWGWFARAPEEPQARAAYLCAPVALVAGTAAHLEALMGDDDRVVPPTPPWRFNPAGACRRLVARASEDAAN